MVHLLDLARIDVAALRAGESAAWRDFLAQCDPLLHAIASWPKWRFDPHAREDVVQATRTSLSQSIATLASDAALPAFVRRVCVNRCIDAVRRRLREQAHVAHPLAWEDDATDPIADAPADASYDPVREILLAERAAALRQAMGRLDAPCANAVRSFYVEGRSYRDMAQAEGVAVNTVGSRLSRCLDRLRQLLRGEDAG